MCCLFGVLDYGKALGKKNMAKIVSVLSQECEVRGTDATGIAYCHSGKLNIYKRPIAAHRLRFRIPSGCHIVMGHNRLTTQGSEKFNSNNHPFRGRTPDTIFALAHNGILRNDTELRVTEKLPLTRIKTDSYVAVQLIEKEKALNFNSLRHMAERVEGSFMFTALDQNGSLYFIKGDNPICIYNFSGPGFYMYASTEEILNKAVARLGLQDYRHEQVRLNAGDILRLDSSGKEEKERFTYRESRHLWNLNGNKGYSYYNYSLFHDVSYWEELRQMANVFGYTPDDVDRFRKLGYPPDVVEEILYDGTHLEAEYEYDYCDGSF